MGKGKVLGVVEMQRRLVWLERLLIRRLGVSEREARACLFVASSIANEDNGCIEQDEVFPMAIAMGLAVSHRDMDKPENLTATADEMKRKWREMDNEAGRYLNLIDGK